MLRSFPLRWASLALALAALPPLCAQTVVFSDDFESGTAAWTLSGSWGTSTAYSVSGTNALTESPAGNYASNLDISATMASGVDLSAVLDAQLSFQAIYDIEAGFDYCYIQASGDGGPWITLDVFDGEGLLSPWVPYTYSLGGFVGDSDVKVRFRFTSDGAVEYDGFYVDDVEITTFSTDLSPPLILHDGPVDYEGVDGAFTAEAELVDISGIASTWLYYSVDGGPLDSVAGAPLTGDTWRYVVPAQAPGALVQYSLRATDASATGNSAFADDFAYVAGNYLGYDNGVISFVNSFGPLGLSGDGCAVRMSLPGATDVVTMLFRNYTDPTRPNDDMTVHVWADAGGLPGADLIAPFTVSPAASLGSPNVMTVIDLRPFSADLSGLTGSFWIGFSTPVGQTWVSQTTPGIAGRTAVFSGGLWTAITDDYHFRVVHGPVAGAPEADFLVDATADPTVAFTDASTNSPTAWAWDFGDGGSASVANPTHTYANNADYTVCLTATNAVGSDTHCETVTVSGVVFPPVTAWAVDTSADPLFGFTDASANDPTAWAWTFGDGASSSVADPTHTYAANGRYEVCLTPSNSAGSGTAVCDSVTVRGVPSGLGGTALAIPALWPNPASEAVHLRWPLGDGFARTGETLTWTLSDATGRVLRSGRATAGPAPLTLAVRDLAAGAYTLRATGPGGTAAARVQVQR